MTEYTYKDVIDDPKDPRIEIGAEYYYCDNDTYCLYRANNNDVAHLARLERVYPYTKRQFFINGTYSICIIRKKESEKKYVPFDFSNPEDREKLRGAWIRAKNFPNIEYQIVSIIGFGENRVYIGNRTDGITPESFMNVYEFLDGTPCGKLVEVEDDAE